MGPAHERVAAPAKLCSYTRSCLLHPSLSEVLGPLQVDERQLVRGLIGIHEKQYPDASGRGPSNCRLLGAQEGHVLPPQVAGCLGREFRVEGRA